MSKRQWFKVSKVEQGSECETCSKEITRDQQRFGQARQSDDGSARHGSCPPKEGKKWQIKN